MPGHSRTLIVFLSAVGIAAAAAASVEAQQTTPAVIHACYVPLTGTVYRIKETGLRQACSSSSHIEFSWTDGDGALRPTGASKGDVLQFDGTAWKAVNPQSLGVGGVTGYEIVSVTATNSYSTPVPVVLSTSLFICGPSRECEELTYVYQTTAASVMKSFSCPAGKKAFGAFAASEIGTDMLKDGQVRVITPPLQRTSPQQVIQLPFGAPHTPEYVTNQLPNSPDTTPDNFSVRLVCANAS